MEPTLLHCPGCAARLRVRLGDLALLRGRPCPRCGAPLDRLADAPDEPPTVAPPEAEAEPRSRRAFGVAFGAALLASVAGWTLLDHLPATSTGSADPWPVAAAPPVAAPPPLIVAPRPEPSVEPPPPGPVEPPEPDPSPPPPPVPADLAIRGPGDHDPSAHPAPSTPSPVSLRPPADPSLGPPPPPPTSATAPAGPRRVLVRDGRGRAVVAREYGTVDGRLAVILPDGRIGWPEGIVATDRPFRPLTIDQLRADLADDPEYAPFQILQTAHYLILYQSSKPFAQASGNLLERLFDGLTGALRKRGLPIRDPEFPLVAIIYQTEDDFRRAHRVAPEVQALYEIQSNRIDLYEKSSRDAAAPEVSALRKPQTVAHEGTHQILHNVGIQPRLSDWPLWLVEGLAEYCSPPKATRTGTDWAGLGAANPIHLATIRDLDDPVPAGGPGRTEPVVDRDRRRPMVEYLVTRTELTPTDYALSWALCHYLATQRVDEFTRYVAELGRLRPFEARSPEEQLATFRATFGTDLAGMSTKVARHLKKFKVDALPYYAVIFERPIGRGALRRHAMVSQSPSVIRQWLESVGGPDGMNGQWHAFPYPTRKQALDAVDQWLNAGP